MKTFCFENFSSFFCCNGYISLSLGIQRGKRTNCFQGEKILKISVGGKEGKKKFDAFICGMKIISIWAIFFLFLFSIWQIGTESGKILKNLKFYFCLCSLLMFSIKSSSWLVDELLLGSLYKWSCMNNLFEVKFKTYSKGYAVIIFIPL